VVVVNDIPGHFEVLAGVVHLLIKQLHVRPDVLYTGNPAMPHAWGLLSWLGEQLQGSSAGSMGLQQGTAGTAGSIATRKAPVVPPEGFSTAGARWLPLRTANMTGTLRLQASLLMCVSAELAPSVCR
jgi:hypothetical protein